jgi:hypothetical protein
MDMESRAARVKAQRAAAGLIADNGLHCPTQAWVDFYNAREAAKTQPRSAALTARLTTLKAAAVASTAR